MRRAGIKFKRHGPASSSSSCDDFSSFSLGADSASLSERTADVSSTSLSLSESVTSAKSSRAR